jgi:hypothetical protein
VGHFLRQACAIEADVNKDGGPAFPFILQGPRISGDIQGMSLRDYFAASALRTFGPLKEPVVGGGENFTGTWCLIRKEEIAQACYTMADAMLAERNK